MKTGKDIFDVIGKAPIGIPEGYFDDLKKRLSAIPSGTPAQKDRSRGIWMTVRPYIALAACFLMAAILGHLLLQSTIGSGPSELNYNEMVYSNLMPSTQPDPVYILSETACEEISDEDIINYLIESGTSEEQLAYLEPQK